MPSAVSATRTPRSSVKRKDAWGAATEDAIVRCRSRVSHRRWSPLDIIRRSSDPPPRTRFFSTASSDNDSLNLSAVLEKIGVRNGPRGSGLRAKASDSLAMPTPLLKW